MIQLIVLWTTVHVTDKVSLLVSAAGLPIRTEVTAGQTWNNLGFNLVIPENLPTPSVLLADRGALLPREALFISRLCSGFGLRLT